MDKAKSIANLERIVKELKGAPESNGQYEYPNKPIDLDELFAKDFNYDWLVEKFWPLGTHLHIFATAKTGKSLLMLWIACSIAMGRDPFNGASMPRRIVTYIDNEMTEMDLRDRLEDMGYGPNELRGWLKYHLFPIIRPMDTELGGIDALQLCQYDESTVLVIDTLSRVVIGEENSNDTYRNFYNHTGRLLKANGISLVRLDHAGHDKAKSRGASAKADDVDLVYSLERRNDETGKSGFRLTRTHSRVGFVNEQIDLSMTDEPLSIKSGEMRMWTLQAVTKAKQLDALGAPANITQRDAVALLKASEYGPGKTTYLAEALRLRLNRDSKI